MELNKNDKAGYSNDAGYLIIEKLFSSEDIDILKNEIFNIIQNSEHTWLEKNSVKTEAGEFIVIRSIDSISDRIFHTAREKKLINLAESFVMKRVTPLYVEYFDKPPLSHHSSPPHQDQAFYIEHFNDEIGLTFWVALEDCNKLNGCMHLRGTSNNQLLNHKVSNELGFGYELIDGDVSEYEEIPLNAGDALLFNSYIPHYCPANSTKSSRMAIAFSYRTSDYREQFNPWKA